MAYTNVWDLNEPDGTEPAATIADLITQFKLDFAERLNTVLGLPIATALADPVIGFYDAGNSGAAKQIDWLNGPVQKVTLTDNCTFTFINPVAGRPYVLIMIQDGVGGRTASLSTFDFGDSAFTPNTAIGKKNVVTGLWDGSEYIAGVFATGA